MLRKRKNRRYNETNDEECDGERKFDIIAQVKSERFDQIRDKHLLELSANEITLQYVQKNGFDKPILVEEPEGLELRVPPKTFLVRDVRNCVGQNRIIDVMDVKTQKNIEMSMKDWCKYYESKSRDRLLNVISLEFSHTKLDELVESPMIVRMLDWVDLVWPKFLKQSQTESTNTIDKMKYPKVQKYCLMSVKGSYTDFHIDFGGTSVWYHILRGKKIFWMVPPTELNLQIFEEWTLSGMQQDVFFGDTVEECFRVELNAGNTFFIPSGWVHAVYTLEDSLVFGGNFLHSFGIENQLKVSKIEDATKVPVKFRYPFYTEILWYVVQHYVYCLTQKDHLHKPPAALQTASQISEAKQTVSESAKTDKVHTEIEDESTESEQDDSDSKKKKSNAGSKRKLPSRTSKKGASSKKTIKAPPSDDESTDIDSSNEELVKPAKISPTNTCRMTKNSLLRLQYEVEEQQLTSGSKTSIKDSASQNVKAQKKKPDPSQAVTPQPKTSTMNLAEIVLSHESKINGWSAGAGQSIWSNPCSETKEPKKVHITKYELIGLKVLVKHLSKLSGTKKNLPTLIRNSRALLDDCRKLISEHEHDDPELAITGKPISLELLSVANKTDMNELIGQFFKPVENSLSAEVKGSNTLTTSNTPNSINNNFIKSKPDTVSPNQQQRLKTSHLDGAHKGDEKKISNSSSSLEAHNDKELPTKLSPHKETKCLSPNKKSSYSVTSTVVPNSSPPPRPKSPPTRPLSNNQYTSKTKNNNNLILPGSFADLIAATSTEKKSSDGTGSVATSSIFGVKEFALSKPGSSYPSTSKTKSNNSNMPPSSFVDVFDAFYPTSSKISAKEKEKMSLGGLTSNPKSFNSHRSSPGTSQIIDTLASTPSASGTNVARDQSLPPKQPNSPEPPKAAMQKRFMTPNQIRPMSKEKLIYASAPYISPVHASEQVRPPNAPYPWQTPTPNYSPSTPRQQTTSSTSSISPPIPGTPTIQPPTYSPANSHPSTSLATHDTDHSTQSTPHNNPRENTNHGDTNNNRGNIINSLSKQKVHEETTNDPKSQEASNLSSRNEISATNRLESSVSKSKCQTSMEDPHKDQSTSKESIAPQLKTHEDSDEKLAAAKKITKPKCPPKKSKEARQVLEQSNFEIKPAVATSVIKLATVTPQVLPTAPTIPAQAAPVPKAKTKRVKKQKDSDKPADSSTPPQGTTVFNTQLRAQQPQVFCGLVTPPASSASNAKPTTQSYLISRPLIFNTMPAYSTAQFPQVSRVPVPLLTTSMSSPLGLPLQQGTRIVWATQPQRLSNQAASIPAAHNPLANLNPISSSPAVTTTTSTEKLGASTSQPRSLSSTPDNAALLSLATTALSTAPLMSSSALGQLSNRTSAQQAIMVSSASNQQALFAAGQQLFRPFMQRLPMTRYVTHPNVSGVPRAPQSGQLVFARIPNQNQPRYLITPPGFIQQRFQAPQLNPNQPTPTLAFTTIKPPTSDAGKVMKTKKVKTN